MAAELRSALVLSHDFGLTPADIVRLRVRRHLAVLSAGKTGRPGPTLPDELLSSPTGPIQAGAGSVIAAGWAVPDGPTAALLTEFHRRRGWR